MTISTATIKRKKRKRGMYSSRSDRAISETTRQIFIIFISYFVPGWKTRAKHHADAAERGSINSEGGGGTWFSNCFFGQLLLIFVRLDRTTFFFSHSQRNER